MSERFVYVARVETGDELAVRRILREVPERALNDHGVREFASYVGSGYCVLQFELPDGDFQQQWTELFNDERMSTFTRSLANHLVEGDQISRTYTSGTARVHGGTDHTADGGDTVTSAELPLTAEVSRWKIEA